MSNIWFIAIAQGFVFALAGIAIRVQYSLFKGFDFSVAASIAVAAETFTVVANRFQLAPPSALLAGTLSSLTASLIIMCGWNLSIWAVLRRLKKFNKNTGSALFVTSLGFSVGASGLIGLLRGPGLRQSFFNALAQVSLLGMKLELSNLFIIITGALAALATLLWLRTPSGLGLALIAQNEEFAQELGVQKIRIIMPCAIVGGATTGLIGSYTSLSSGSTPDIGLPIFLYGAGAALVFQSARIQSCLWGGSLLGIFYVISQLFVSPSWVNAILFGAVVLLITLRGSSRTRQGLR